MLIDEFANDNMVNTDGNILEDGEWALFEWRAPLKIRSFQIQPCSILEQGQCLVFCANEKTEKVLLFI